MPMTGYIIQKGCRLQRSNLYAVPAFYPKDLLRWTDVQVRIGMTAPSV